ncbi:hypothetical protein DNK57_08660 [Methanothermobacter thermautotrophicus]|uniref:Uncharacterized protein n=2 Tax=Methanothermobacter thermautotrophicus TaxID=145262 RepID=A0A842YTB6_METTF|nr:hypothetical protein [Methanothermobacter thermautotrophicus]
MFMRIIEGTCPAAAMDAGGRFLIPVFRVRFLLIEKGINAVSLKPIMCIVMEGEMRYILSLEDPGDFMEHP